MTMRCKICTNPQRIKIDREIVRGGNLSKIAQKYGVPYDSLYNHAQNHISRQLAQVWNKRDEDAELDLLNKIDLIISRAEDIFTRNYNKQKDSLALKALDSQRSTIELLAKISYSLHQAKLAEIEASQLQNNEEDTLMLEEKLKVLTIPELKMLARIQDKIENQSKEIIIPEKENVPDTLKDDIFEPDSSVEEVEDSLEEEVEDTPKLKRDPTGRMYVKAVEPKQIPE